MIEIDKCTYDFINQHAESDVAKLSFQRNSYPHVDFPFALRQIEGRKKGLVKFPLLAKCENFIYPVSISVEQCSSEYTAKYKSKLLVGKSIADITGGLGIDTLFISKEASEVYYIEQNKELYEVFEHNMKTLVCNNIQIRCGNGVDYIAQTKIPFDVIYLDPARRNIHNQKIVSLSDCTPDFYEIKNLLFSKSNYVLLKASPMLDIKKVLSELPNVLEVHVLSVKNECKELLFYIDSQRKAECPKIFCINLLPENEVDEFKFSYNEESNAAISYAETVNKYLYEPNSSILKAGAFKTVAQRFGLAKLHLHSHLYTSAEVMQDFQGKIFEVQSVFSLDEKGIKQFLQDRKANIVVRNYPLSAPEIKKKFRIVEKDTETFLFATTIANNKKTAILCKRIDKNITSDY